VTTAFVLVNIEIGYEEEVLKKIKMIPEVKEAHILHGVYDIIAVLETGDKQYLKEVIHMKIRRLDKVRSTMTMFSYTKAASMSVR
jgi:DNA-binding Lrp family transcriptional regulator